VRSYPIAVSSIRQIPESVDKTKENNGVGVDDFPFYAWLEAMVLCFLS
jgi:hypothetical protein